MAEHLFGDNQDCKNMAYYLLGEGIGLGVLEEDQLFNGSLGVASELGHVSTDINGLPCDCGNRGCLELYCSAVAIHRDAIVSGAAAAAIIQFLAQPTLFAHLARTRAGSGPSGGPT